MSKADRRGISLRGTTYRRVRAYCRLNKIPMTAWVEALITKNMDLAGQPVPERVEPTKPRACYSKKPPGNPSDHFTF